MDPATLPRLVHAYASICDPDRMARYLRVDGHPQWLQLCADPAKRANKRDAKFQMLGKLMYRCDMDSLYESYSDARKGHFRKALKDAKAAQRAVPGPASAPLTHESVVCQNAVEHMKEVLQPGCFFSVSPFGDGNRPALLSLADRMSRSWKPVIDGPQLQADIAQGHEVQENVDFANDLFFRVIHSRPKGMRTARLPHAAAGRLQRPDLAVTMHRNMSHDPAQPAVCNDPILFSGLATCILGDLQRCSSGSLLTLFHQWEVPKSMLYTLRGVACSATEDELSRAVGIMVNAATGTSAQVPDHLQSVFAELSNAGLVALSDDSSAGADTCARLTDAGLSRLVAWLHVKYVGQVCCIRPNMELQDRSCFELCMMLTEAGWAWRALPTKKEERLALAYSEGDERIWYSSSASLCKLYMVALLRSASLLGRDSAVRSIPHWTAKPVEDYTRILQGLAPHPALVADIDPGSRRQPARRNRSDRRQLAQAVAALEDGPAGDEENEGAPEGEGDLDLPMDVLEAEVDKVLGAETSVDIAPAQPLEPQRRARAARGSGAASSSGAAPAAPCPEEIAFNEHMRNLCRCNPWGPFTFVWRPAGVDIPHGAVQVTCPFHRKTDSTDCKKTMSLRERSAEEGNVVLWTLRHWCNQAINFDRQRDHVVPYKLYPDLAPARVIIERQQVVEGPPFRAMTDEELDRLEAEADAAAAAAAAAAAPPPLPPPAAAPHAVDDLVDAVGPPPDAPGRGGRRGGRGRGRCDGPRGGRRGGRGRGRAGRQAAARAGAEPVAPRSSDSKSDEQGPDSSDGAASTSGSNSAVAVVAEPEPAAAGAAPGEESGESSSKSSSSSSSSSRRSSS